MRQLLSTGDWSGAEVLEIGCGPDSPLLPILQRQRAGVHIHQIDAQADVVVAARQRNPAGLVQQMLASDMSGIASGSKDLVIAMSVFDQNPAMVLARMAREIHRVLAVNGLVVYVHNEELNLPATAASLLRHPTGPRLLLPRNRWQPPNEQEYSSGDEAQIARAWTGGGARLAPLEMYLRGVLPQRYGQAAPTANGKIAVPFLRRCTPAVMDQVREAVAFLRDAMGVPLTDHPTADLLQNVVARALYSPEHGFCRLRSGMFEIRRCTPWRAWFEGKPPRTCFVRGVARFGAARADTPSPVPEFDQALNDLPAPREDELLLVGYQYGFVARKSVDPIGRA
ncbi:MAG: class I SAM-dependent methyltransferase [Pirellulaceae bacterium]